MVRRQAKALSSNASSDGRETSDNVTLSDEVRESLLNVLRDTSANASAKASAARTLMEYFANTKDVKNNTARGVEMSADELDAAIAALRD